jgi:hypothetical protein
MSVTIQGNTLLRASLSLVLIAATSVAGAQEAAMRTVDHQDYQLQVPANWESFDSETPDGGLVQIFYDPDLKASSRQCMLESSTHKLSQEELASQPMKSAWQQKRWAEVLPHLTDATDVVMKESSYSSNGKGQGQHVGEFTFYASQFFWHSRSYIMHSPDRLINLTCSATSHNSPVEAEKAFQQITPMISRIAHSITQSK